MKLIIAGSRDITDIKVLYDYLPFVLDKVRVTEVVCGMAAGVDTLGFNWAVENNIPIKKFPADWVQYGKSAGPIRNKEMGKYADAALIICNNGSKGSINMLSNMLAYKKPYVFVDLKDMELGYISENNWPVI